MITRRAAMALGAVPFVKGASHSIAKIEPRGVLIRECSIPGETRADDVTPAHPNGIQVSRSRWLLVYSTRGFRGVDDDMSIIYQLRESAPDGRVLKEGAFARAITNWDPLGNGKRDYVRQYGHPVAFGVPRGAIIQGKPASNANVFVAKWRKCARAWDRQTNYVLHASEDPEIESLTQAVEWVQFRLNAAEDDIEILRPATALRQKGYEQGPRFCSADVHYINESFVQAVPFNRERTEWADCCHFDKGRIACLKNTFNRKSRLYDWTETGPLLDGGPGDGIGEASLARWRDDWIIAARSSKGAAAWFRTADPFGRPPRAVRPDSPHITVPMTAYTWTDGALRLFSGDARISPYKNCRDPLYCWDIDPDTGFAASNRRVIFDTVQAHLPIHPAAGPKVDMCKLLASQGRTQIIVYRVSIRAFNHPYRGSSGVIATIPLASGQEKAVCAIYYSAVFYSEAYPPAWVFV